MISFESVSVFFLAPGKEGDLSVLAAALIEGDSEVLVALLHQNRLSSYLRGSENIGKCETIHKNEMFVIKVVF